MNNAVMQTSATIGAPVYYFGFTGNVAPGATTVISNMPGSGPNTANTTPATEVTQLVSAMATYSTASCCCVASPVVASAQSPILLACAH
ncbi:hypothetical protein [Paraburkholderia sp. J76]|uniref:hypothetical protein n=1 Tax=Paraburkholderia sp. J76 TaxID=2805439 RepID=UPI002ABE4381|nr:hypothetical protein [Paraburkholderia sp. J76]